MTTESIGIILGPSKWNLLIDGLGLGGSVEFTIKQGRNQLTIFAIPLSATVINEAADENWKLECRLVGKGSVKPFHESNTLLQWFVHLQTVSISYCSRNRRGTVK